jgi:hypothetical protein
MRVAENLKHWVSASTGIAHTAINAAARTTKDQPLEIR